MNNDTVSACPTLTDTQARLEAARCLMCDDPPCVAACPAEVPVKHFIRALRFDNPRRAINLIRERNVLAGICGLACPVDELCVGACASTELSTPIAINQLQHYAAQTELDSGRQPAAPRQSGHKVAVIGGGPSGLAAAAELARLGHLPTIFEKHQCAGGICNYGVPSHRLPRELVAGEVEYIRNLGVEFKLGSTFGEQGTLDDLFADGFDAVYLACGLQQAIMPPMPGSQLDGVYNWKDILDACSVAELDAGDPPIVAHNVIIVGGGSVAMDVATRVSELGADEIDIVCLEAPREMPADWDELAEVWDLGARFHTRSMPGEITAKNGQVTGLKAVRIRWKEPDLFVPSNAEIIPGTEYWLPAEMVIFAIGAKPAAKLAEQLPGVDVDETGRIVVDAETGATSRVGVYAGGDVAGHSPPFQGGVGGGSSAPRQGDDPPVVPPGRGDSWRGTIVLAVAEGKRAGGEIDAYLRGLNQ
ncbi:MAG: FAD-dependent oxidoreductase [Planctomycetota bacterium]